MAVAAPGTVVPTIYYIHGAGASARSFVWLRDQQPAHRAMFLHYSIDDKLVDVIAAAAAEIATVEGPVSVIGHSFGGLVALGLHDCPQVRALVTLCAPYGGLAGAGMMSLFNTHQLFRDLSAYGSILTKLRAIRRSKPFLPIIATAGLPVTREANDGVVTVQSAMALPDQSFLPFPVNHYEILLDRLVAGEIASFLEPHLQ